AGVAQAARVRPAGAEHAVRTRDGIDVHVFRPVVAGELLQQLRVPQYDVAVRVDDAGRGLVDQRPRALADLGALAPARPSGRGDPQSVDRARPKRRHRRPRDRRTAGERYGRYEFVDAATRVAVARRELVSVDRRAV